jgi:hypothetical protein
MRSLTRRLSVLRTLTWPLVLTFIGTALLSLGVAYLAIHAYRTVQGLPPIFELITLQFLPRLWRGVLLLLVGLAAFAAGIWQLGGLAVIPLRDNEPAGSDDLVLGYRRDHPPTIAVLSGGPGLLVLSAMGDQVRRLTCVVPVQDPVEYYYRAAGLFNKSNVYYVVPTPEPVQVMAELDDGTTMDVRHLALDASVAARHVAKLRLERSGEGELQLTRLAGEAIRDADALVLGPGSLFESILPNLLIDELREAVANSKARKIYVCNLMTEPGRTTGFGVADHIRALKRYGVTPDYVLVNAQRIDSEVYRLYAAAHQSPVYLDPEEAEETTVLAGDQAMRRVLIEGAMVIEADLASSVIQYTASLSSPAESRAVRVLRHDSQKLAATILELLRRT